MSQENISALPSLEAIRCQFKEWRETRRNRRERIPEELWSAAVELRKQYPVNQISRALRLNFTDLKKRILEQDTHFSKREKLSSDNFIELNWESGFTSSECVIEMEDTSGSKMRMSFKGNSNLDLLELGKAFWYKGK
jgi:hypothetical protein